MRTKVGHWDPFGVTPRDDGSAKVSLWAPHADFVEFCILRGSETRGFVEERHSLTHRVQNVHYDIIPNVPVGSRYGFRVHGPWDPHKGMRFNPNKFLVDPYAKLLVGELINDPAIFDYDVNDPHTMSTLDSIDFVPHSVVSSSSFDWQGDRPLERPWNETVIYETHVKGFTKLHPSVLETERGTFRGLATPEVLEHLKHIGVTAVELLPVHHYVDEVHLMETGLTNYWGYNTLGFFAPHSGYSVSEGSQIDDFKYMVRELHKVGIEVILDVVYNHTAEGGLDGPSLSFKGINNKDFYRLDEDGNYIDFAGCGNTINAAKPQALQLIMDSLRYWVTEMHVDGFRFDLAAALARSFYDVDMLGNFLTTIQQDPILRRVKLIAEPWDIGPGGYQVGSFPPLWSEWNDKYRDDVRDFWRGESGIAGIGWRLSGSQDVYGGDGTDPYTSINFVTAHDGFTLRDLVSFNHKHNEANLEENRDGTDNNRSYNYGVEGKTTDPQIIETRSRQIRNFLATLFLSGGVPMLMAGDELHRTQQGNNNSYCQDNPISWINWDLQQEDWDLVDFTATLAHIRATHPALRPLGFFTGNPHFDNGPKDLAWFAPNAHEIEHWHSESHSTIGMFLTPDPSESLYAIFHAGAEPVSVTLPGAPYAERYTPILDTNAINGVPTGEQHNAGDSITMPPRSTYVMRAHT